MINLIAPILLMEEGVGLLTKNSTTQMIAEENNLHEIAPWAPNLKF